MQETIKKLKTLLPASKFVVTGSYALSLYGLIDSSFVKDIDIILVKPDAIAIANIENFVKDFPAKTKANGESILKGIFVLDNIKIDVFVDDKYTESTLCIDGIEYAKVPPIIRAKQSFGRMKDWIQCRAMSRLFFKQEEFESALNEKGLSLLGSSYK